MKVNVKMYSREITDKVTNRKFNVHKAILLNAKEDAFKYVDLKFFIKREMVEKALREVPDGFFSVSVSKVVKKEYTTKNNEKAFQYVLHVDGMDPLPLTDEFRAKFDSIMDEQNKKSITEMLN